MTNRGRILGLLALLVLLVIAAPPAAHAKPPRPVVVVGMSGVGWSEVTTATPALRSLLTDGATGNLVPRSVRTVSCPVDGWLAVSAGARAAGPSDCVAPRPPVDGLVADWADYRRAVDDQPYGAELGLLAATLADHAIDATALGPGAALALADESGRVSEYAGPAGDPQQLAATLPAVLVDAQLTIVDIGGAEDGLAELDARLDAVLDAVREHRPEAVVLVASVADDAAATAAAMQIGALLDPAGDGARELGSPSTRIAALGQVTDLAPTILGLLGIDPPPSMVGAVLQPGERAPADHQAQLIDAAQHAQAGAGRVAGVYEALVVLGVLLCAAGWLAARRGHVLWLPVVLFVGALPAATFLANLVPWWRFSAPGFAYGGALVLVAAGIAALAVCGPWRGSRWGPAVCVAAVTELTLLAGVLGVPALQYAAPMGIAPLVGGRFYGFGNSAFALHATASLALAAAAASALVHRGERRRAALAVGGIGVVVVIVDGHPSLGADFGGPPALLPAFGVLALLALGLRLTASRLALVASGSALAALSLSVLDWLRPPQERSHLGRFVQTVIDGELGGVLARKASQNLANLTGSWLTVLAVVGAVFLAVVVWPRLRGIAMARPLLVALSIAWGVGFAVNDSGVLVPAVGMMLGVPLLVQLASSTAAKAAIE